MRTAKRRCLFAALAITLGAASCGDAPAEQTAAAPLVSAAQAESAPTTLPSGVTTVSTGAIATAKAPQPDAGVLGFTAALVGGGQFDGASMAGKPVAFWFWAPT